MVSLIFIIKGTLCAGYGIEAQTYDLSLTTSIGNRTAILSFYLKEKYLFILNYCFYTLPQGNKKRYANDQLI